MSDSRSISGSVQVDQSSIEIAAFQLMQHIGNYETDENQDRKYWLTLYRQCIKATNRNSLESILRID
jgi:hypothetical protein